MNKICRKKLHIKLETLIGGAQQDTGETILRLKKFCPRWKFLRIRKIYPICGSEILDSEHPHPYIPYVS